MTRRCPMRITSVVLLSAVAALAGCGEGAISESGAREAKNTPRDAPVEPYDPEVDGGAKSALGKAMEAGERLEGKVDDYNSRLEKEMEGGG